VSPEASSSEKDVETMPTQKLFKKRVRARMTKTGESYTAARCQLLRKAGESPAPAPEQPSSAIPADALLVGDASMQRATGKGHAEWFAVLDAWQATSHSHTEIATWLREAHGVSGWWAQNITVSYERVRGVRAVHQQRDGYTISVTKTIATDPDRALAAFTSTTVRRRWLPDAEMRRRPTRAVLTARFDWSDPRSRVVVNIVPKGGGKALIAVGHEQLPDAESAERLKTAWRGWLVQLKAVLEGR
jgi:hypothetical protein